MKKIINLFSALFVATFLFAQQPGLVQRSQIVEKLDGKEYYIHLVRQGENLQNIAATYQVSVSEINENNPRLKGVASIGDVLKIPKYGSDVRSTETTPKPPVTDPAAQNRQAAPKQTSAGANTHTVVARETFFGIARTYNITVADLQAANPDIEVLQPGQVLLIPNMDAFATPSAHQQAATQADEQTTQAVPSQQPDTYTAQAGETLFSISRKLGLSIDDLIRLNPELEQGLKAGQTIRLIQEKPTGNNQFITTQDTTVSYIYHRVRRGETLYSLSRRYEVSIEVILEYNPHVIDGLQPRQVLQIPVYEITTKKVLREIVPIEPIDIPIDTVIAFFPDDCLSVPDTNRVYKIALMLPFFLDSPPEIFQADTLRPAEQVSPNRSYEFMQFFYGAKLAIDSLGLSGLKARVYVYDVDNTPESVAKVLAEPALTEMDIIIGPMYAAGFDRIARFARDHRIRIINPLSTRSEFLLHNPYAVKAQPSSKDQVNYIASYIKNNLADRNIIVVRQFSFSETATLDIFRKELSDSKLHEVIYIRDSLEGVIRHLDKNKDNIVIGLSTDKVFIIDLVRKLNDIRSQYQISCFGLKEWEDFALDTDYIVNLQLHLPATDFIDYDSEPVKQFIRSFRTKYNTEPLPNRFAFAAFDITWYFLNAMMKFGDDFEECLPAYSYRGLQFPFDFEPAGRHGMENKGLCIYRIQDFRKIQVTHRKQ